MKNILKKVSRAVSHEVKKVEHVATQATTTVSKAATGGAHVVAKSGQHALGAAGHLGRSAIHQVGQGGKHALHEVEHGGQQVIHRIKEGVEDLAGDVALKLVRDAAHAALSKNKHFLTKVSGTFKVLHHDAAAAAAMKRIAIASKTLRINQQLRDDLQYIGVKLGISKAQGAAPASSRAPAPVAAQRSGLSSSARANTVASAPSPNVAAPTPAPAGPAPSHAPDHGNNSCWGLMMGASGEAGKGKSISVGFVVDCRTNKVRGIKEIDSFTGAEAGADMSAVFFWSPGNIDSQAGPCVGIGIDVVLTVGVTMSVSWSVPGKPSIAALHGIGHQTPGFSLGLGTGEEVGASIQWGVTTLFG